MSVRTGETVVVMIGHPLHRQVVTVREVWSNMAIGGDAFTAALKDGTAPGLDHLGSFTEDQIVARGL